jgi:hypothetical protein
LQFAAAPKKVAEKGFKMKSIRNGFFSIKCLHSILSWTDVERISSLFLCNLSELIETL